MLLTGPHTFTAVFINPDHRLVSLDTSLLDSDLYSFLQLIEGEERAVINTFNRIERDPRHTDVTVVDWRFIVDRSHGQWRMASRRLGPGDAAAHPHLAPYFERGFDAATLAGLDQLEGHPRFYRRTPLRLDEHGEVETYLLTPAQVEGCLPIASGCWRSHRRERPR